MILSVLQTLMLNPAHVPLCAEHTLRRLCSRGFDLKLKPQTSQAGLQLQTHGHRLWTPVPAQAAAFKYTKFPIHLELQTREWSVTAVLILMHLVHHLSTQVPRCSRKLLRFFRVFVVSIGCTADIAWKGSVLFDRIDKCR